MSVTRFSFQSSSNWLIGGVVLAALLSSCGGRTLLDDRGGAGGDFVWVDSLPPDAGLAGSGAGDAGSGGASSQGGSAGTVSGGSGGTIEPGGAGNGGTAAVDAGPPPINLLTNSGFEEGHEGWRAFGPPGTVVDTSVDYPHGGEQCLLARERTMSSSGPLGDITPWLVPDVADYGLKAWVRLPSGTARVGVNVRVRCEDAITSYIWVAGGSVSNEWTELSGQFTLPSCTLSDLSLILDGPAADVDLYVDDVLLFVADP